LCLRSSWQSFVLAHHQATKPEHKFGQQPCNKVS
jgi:hypothetical protein